ncbi:hypothetical protein [Inhella sp.]|uniref:hypothetical protein n=1 Tax=Inhella sp. TaxID=1921806 RepID=UPI0035B4BE32
MNLNLPRAAAWSAAFLGLGYVLSFVLQTTLFNPGGPLTPTTRLDFVLEHRRAWQAWLLLYPAQGLALGLLAQGLHERLAARAPGWMALATPLAWVWAALLIASGFIGILGVEVLARQPAREGLLGLWLALGVVQDALGGGNELVGGVWVLLIGAAAAQAQAWGRGLIGFGTLIGLGGVLSIWPPLQEAVMLFGLGQIPWFLALAWVLARPQAARAEGLVAA